MDVQAMRTLFDYNQWVNRRLLATAEMVPAERTLEFFGASFDTIRGTLAHILNAEINWLSRWRGVTPTGRLTADDFDSIPAFRARWQRQEEDLEAFFAELTPERLQAPVRYIHASGKAQELPLWQLMVHLVTHGTHHRSELADMLTRTGHEPEPTGFLAFCVERTGQG